MKSRRALTVVAFALLGLGCSDDGASHSPVEVHASVLSISWARPPRCWARRSSTRMGARSHFAFVTDTDERIGVVADDFHFSGEYVSASGTAMESDRSSFILKGDRNEIYGWVVLHDRNIAYEYTTSRGGRVAVEKVPVTKIFPVCDSDIETFDDAAAETAGPSAGAGRRPPSRRRVRRFVGHEQASEPARSDQGALHGRRSFAAGQGPAVARLADRRGRVLRFRRQRHDGRRGVQRHAHAKSG